MTGALARTLRALVALAATAGCVALVAGQDACVLASEGGDLPRLPDSRPTIVHSSLVPTTNAVLTTFPKSFLVPVELADPTVTFFYAAFIDYNPFTGEGLVESPRQSAFVPANQVSRRSGRIRTIEVAIPTPTDLASCYKIEIVVALRLNARDGKNAHTPEEPGGDIATWFYNPNGDLGGCPSRGTGIDASFDAEAGDAGPQ
jgi:hypothetical protein